MGNQKNSKIAYDFFISKGMSAVGAAGLVGNLLSESNVDPNGPAGDGGQAHGIAQWHPDRYSQWVVHDPLNALPGQDLELDTQLDAVWREMQNRRDPSGKLSQWDALKQIGDVPSAARYVNDYYEVSSTAHTPAPDRVKNAQAVAAGNGDVAGSSDNHSASNGELASTAKDKVTGGVSAALDFTKGKLFEAGIGVLGVLAVVAGIVFIIMSTRAGKVVTSAATHGVA